MLHDITESNRAGWNQIHTARPGRPASYFARGGSTLSADELAAAGEVRGRRVLQLACSCGDEALSWTQLGAVVTGVDISEVALDMARGKSAEAGIPVDFRRADMLTLPADLTGFDLVYLSWAPSAGSRSSPSSPLWSPRAWLPAGRSSWPTITRSGKSSLSEALGS